MIASLGINELNELAIEVWSTMANITLTPSEELVKPNKAGGCVVASVQILGSWEGAVRLDMDMRLAIGTTSQLLGLEEAEVSSDDMRDAAGELANMTGGGLKSLMPQPCSLSLPTVASGDQSLEVVIRHGRVLMQTSLTCEYGTLLVTVIEKEVRS
jgi:chemotaxis protein CheX